jgi:hypothetical protein
MKFRSQADRIIYILKDLAPKQLTAREIADELIGRFPTHYQNKANTPTYEGSLERLVPQLTAEVGSQKDRLTSKNAHIRMRDQPRPRVYWYATAEEILLESDDELADGTTADWAPTEKVPQAVSPGAIVVKQTLPLEHELYDPLLNYLHQELSLCASRIDERRSLNQHGAGGNQWLYPDIVAMESTPADWTPTIRNCVRNSGSPQLRMQSFEVKRRLTRGNVRQHFFQTVSNSSWANEAYLVAAVLEDNAEKELRMLSALHGVGFILLNHQNPSESDILLPAKSRPDVDWASVNRLAIENRDFSRFMESVDNYLQTGSLMAFDTSRRKR